MKHPRKIDHALVDAYLARRALDYLVGFTLSPVLWRKLPGARSAGRVQSVALAARLRPRTGDREVRCARILVAGRDARDAAQRQFRGASGRRRRQEDPRGSISAPARKPRTSRTALETAAFTVPSVEAKPARRNPPPPFTTSTLQQEASRKLGFAPAHTMRIAQRLYEGIDIERRDRRPHYLYANRRHRHGPGSDRRHPLDDRQELRQGLCAGCAAPLPEQVEECAGSA